ATIKTPRALLRDNNNATIMPTPRHRGSHPDCRCLPILIAALHEGMAYEEVARTLRIPVGTVRSRLSRGRDHLRRLLDMGKEASSDLRRRAA
ncbi:MAG: sigma factor-like helix-turn-helix DNA-binding protein, partial [Stellaceae bacterium]